MQGRVYRISRTGRHGDLPHPYVVIVPITSSQMLCIPGLTPGRHEVTKAEKAAFTVGFWGNAFKVIISNQHHISGAPGNLELHECAYIVATPDRVEANTLQKGSFWGTMSLAGLAAIAEGCLEARKNRPGLYTDAEARALNAIIEQHRKASEPRK